MKFTQRVSLAAGLLLILVGLYLMLPWKQERKKFQPKEILHQRSEKIFRNVVLQSGKTQKKEQKMCNLVNGGSPHYADISTYDLWAKTKFDTHLSGEWEMPDPTFSRSSVVPRLTVILMPHSHNDPGWQKTVDEYYTDQTKHILNNMVNKLTQYRNMTFIWAETVFFSMWWNELDDAEKMYVRRLVQRGQLEFVSGGWVMPDEAITHYGAVVDQLVEGHQWLWTNLGVRPENAWSIDPFGLSGTMPYLWRHSGMQHMVIQRVHQAVKASLSKQGALEFYWRQAWDNSYSNRSDYNGRERALLEFTDEKQVIGVDSVMAVDTTSDFDKNEHLNSIAAGGSASSDILCHIMPFMLYSIMYSCGPNPHICQRFDFGPTQSKNYEEKELAKDITVKSVARDAELLVSQFRAKASFFQFNVILVPIGDDFRYDKEVEWDRQYANYEKLMHYMNDRQDWNLDVRWGTLKDYFSLIDSEINKQDHVKHPVLSGDFFPYSDQNRAYWSGYFSTRPFDKHFCRDLQALLHAADSLNTLSYAYYMKWGLRKEAESRFFQFSAMLQQTRRLLALAQHHDAITGTSKDFVVEDYEKNLLTAYNQGQNVVRHIIQALLTKGKVESPIVFFPAHLRSSAFDIVRRQVIQIPSTGRGTVVTFYNPLGQFRSEVVSLLVDHSAVQVLSSQGKETLPSQISPVWVNASQRVFVEENVFEISFELNILPFSLVTVVLSKLPENILEDAKLHFARISVYNEAILIIPPNLPFMQAPLHPDWREDILVSNGLIELAIDPRTGSLLRLTHLKSGHTTRLRSSFQYYTSRGSGAYIFSPAGKASPLFPVNQKKFEKNFLRPLYSVIPTIRVSEGEIVTFIDISYHSIVFQRITIYSQPSHVASAIFIENVLNIQMLIDKEIVFRFDTDLKNHDLSYFTDQNGFQFIRRRTLHHLPIAANYYPMTSGVILEDAKTRLTLLSAQSHGCASLQKGQLEVMLDRQLVNDDFRGLDEGVRDIKTTVSHFVLFTEAIVGRQKMHSSFMPLSASLSLPALALQDSLHHPILIYFSSVDSDAFFHSLTPVPPPALPCDVAAVSMRSLVTESFGYNGTTLILHRRGYDCSPQTPWVELELVCVPSNPDLTMKDIFGDFAISQIHEMTLTSTKAKQSINPQDKLALKPMELSTFHFYF
ncbi:alpha-mannosidase [Plakobranchus ocellatus]|uniref:Alpha-mannosidase n=1 Tax=Plakobranchus ocellatus TaxID=259542 RepID=A0AAV4CB57_9GAST|nr:alpha-mannosidase [Plakobranchus ocellatus]